MRPPITWLITDTHFYHEEMVTLCGRPVNFTDLIMKHLRHLVASQDTLLHLGDCIFYQYPQLKTMLDSVKGTKVLVLGNHDRRGRNWYVRNGFHFATDMIVQDNILFSHKPVAQFPTGVTLNIHGHWHNSHHRVPEAYGFWRPETHRLLAIEYTNYMPVNLMDFLKQPPHQLDLIESEKACG